MQKTFTNDDNELEKVFEPPDLDALETKIMDAVKLLIDEKLEEVNNKIKELKEMKTKAENPL